MGYMKEQRPPSGLARTFRLGVRFSGTFVAGILLMAGGTAQAQQRTGVYSCKDAHGRSLSSDRPIPECMDREQRELRTTGGTLRKIGPSLSEAELAEREERARQAEWTARLQADARRQERALLVRYPTPAALDRERAEALAQSEAVAIVARERLAELAAERNKIDQEMEFYKAAPASAPPAVRRKLEDNAQSLKAQARLIVAQEAERSRLIARFDDARARLTPQWAGTALSSR